MAVRRCNKRRRANLRRRSEAQHCSSLCSQSEGGRILWRSNTAKNPTKSCAKALAIFATCSWPSLCEQSELQCWRRKDDYSTPAAVLLFLSRTFASVLRLWRIGNGVDGLAIFPFSPNIPSLCGLKSRGPPCKQSREGLWRIKMQYVTCVRGTYVRLLRAGVRGSISRSSQRIRSHGW